MEISSLTSALAKKKVLLTRLFLVIFPMFAIVYLINHISIRGKAVSEQYVKSICGKGNATVVRVKSSGKPASGFLVKPTLILTSTDVVAESTGVNVFFPKGENVPADVVKIAKDGSKLVALRIYREKPHFLPLSNPKTNLTQGDDVFAVGASSDGDSSICSQGVIGYIGKDGAIQHKTSINYNYLGGPLLNGRGEVISINTESGTEINLSQSVNKLISFVSDIESGTTGYIPPKDTISLTLGGDALQGTIINGRENVYTFSGKTGQKVSIEMRSNEINPILKLYSVLGEEQKIVHENDDSGPGSYDSKIVTDLPSNSTYLLIATSLHRGESGNYSLHARVAQ